MQTLPVPPKSKSKSSKKWLKQISKVLLVCVAAFGLLYIGWAYGQGKLSLRGFKSVQNKDVPQTLDYSSLNEVYNALRSNYDGQLDTNAVLDGLKEGMARAAGDPYTEYFNQEQAKDFDESLNGSFTGIGAELSKDKDTIIVVAPISGFPAEKAGLKSKDIIAQIDGVSTAGMSVSDAVKKIRGPKDTTVKLKVVRNGKILDFEIKRDNITIPSVKTEIVNGNIGYMRISRFAEDTSKLAAEGAQQFKDARVKGVILDVRDDPGGLLDQAVNVSSLWLPRGKTIVQERRDGVIISSQASSGNGPLEGMPTVVLVNEGSASASEIVAGALKDNGAATLIGGKTFGKGSVQQLVRLSGGSVLKVTIARWYTPGGRNIDKEGIEPDKTVPLTDEDAQKQNDTQKNAAIDWLKTH